MSVVARPYREDDFETVTSIWLRSWQSTGVASPVTLDDLRQRWPLELAKGWIVHVAVLGSEVVGFVAWIGEKLEQLFISPARQSRGIGKQLLDLVKTYRPDGFYLMAALQTRAGKFHEREGLVRGPVSVHPKFGHEIVRYDWVPRI